MASNEQAGATLEAIYLEHAARLRVRFVYHHLVAEPRQLAEMGRQTVDAVHNLGPGPVSVRPVDGRPVGGSAAIRTFISNSAWGAQIGAV